MRWPLDRSCPKELSEDFQIHHDTDAATGRTSVWDSGPEYFGVEGSSLNLDTAHWRHVIVRDAKLSYTGKYLWLSDVYLLNCTFDIERNVDGQRLVDALLSPMPINFASADQSIPTPAR